MMIPVTLVYQPVSDVTATPSPFSAAIFGRFMPIQSCRQHPQASTYGEPTGQTCRFTPAVPVVMAARSSGYYSRMADVDGERSRAATQIRDLVARYRRVEEGHGLRAYNEARTVNEFILPLFEALDWDIHNILSANEVLPEQAANTGRADWTLSISGVPRILVEAKPLHATLDKPEYAKQAIAYSYSRGVTWAVLTNFRELRLYNAEWALPDPELSRFLTFRWEDYERDFDRLWLLSRGAVADGTLDDEGERNGRKRLRTPVALKTPVTDRLFADLIDFRFDLRKMFIAFNPKVDLATIDHAVQRLLDRLIFIRTAEDRKIEPPDLIALLRDLDRTHSRDQIWERLLAVFRDFERNYDSQLFADQALDRLEMLWAPIWDVVEGLYGSANGVVQYDFRGIDADVLGGVYEQYLSHLSKVGSAGASKGRRSPSADEPSKAFRKAHGVYYTPRWMVRYIVDRTLGPLLHSRTSEGVRALRILDPACGSGSFLVEVYRRLVEYWEARDQPATADAALELRLRILRENLFGIDLDPQAIEIAQLNLLLAALNHRTLLPDISANFVVGNALFGRQDRRPLGDSTDQTWLAPVDTSARFPTARDGFDVVVMNPPYYDLQIHPYQAAALRQTYPEIASGRDDVLYYFLARAIDFCSDRGRIGCVVARYWLDALYAERVRGYLSGHSRVEEVLDFRSYQPFGRHVGVNAAIVIAESGGPSDAARMLVPSDEGFGDVPPSVIQSVASLNPGPPAFVLSQSKLGEDPWRPARVSSARAYPKTVALGEIAYLTQGIKTGSNDTYVVPGKLARRLRLEPEVLRPVLEGADIGRYALLERDRYLIYLDGTAPLSRYPATETYLDGHRDLLAARAEVPGGAFPWWRLQRPRRGAGVEASARLIAPQLATGPRFSLISEAKSLAGAVGLTDTVMIAPLEQGFDPYYLLAVLNSTYGDRATLETSKMKRGGYREFFASNLTHLPIPVLSADVQGLIADYARELQLEIADSSGRLSKGRFDDKLNSEPARAAAIAEIDRLLGAAE
jgi:SAM-dependent methyltransferase